MNQSHSSKEPTRVCFVGNIAYDISEEQIISIFGEVGPVFDRETGKSKGFGFVQYHDIETASSAVRNLNGYSISGRGLRVDFAANEKEDQKDTPANNARIAGLGQRMGGFQPNQPQMGGYQQNLQRGPPPQQNYPQGQQGFSHQQQQPQRGQFNQPQGQPMGQGRSNPVTTVMSSVNPKQISDLLSQMKIFADANPEKARALLDANPQLSFALFQAMLVSNVVEQSVLQSVLGNTKPVESMQQPPPQQRASEQKQEQQKQLLLQVMALTEDQILALPNDQRLQVIALRAQLGASN